MVDLGILNPSEKGSLPESQSVGCMGDPIPWDFQSVDGEPLGLLPPSGSHVELVEASTSPTGRVDAAVADGGLICLEGICVLHRRRIVEMGGWKIARHPGYAEDSPSLPVPLQQPLMRTRPMDLKAPVSALVTSAGPSSSIVHQNRSSNTFY